MSVQYVVIGMFLLNAVILTVGIAALFINPFKENRQAVILPKLILIIGIITSAAFFVPAVLMFLNQMAVGLVVAFLLISLLLSGMIIGYLNCRITYNEESFTVKSFWGIVRTYPYEKVVFLYDKTQDVRLGTEGHAVRVDKDAIGREEFLLFIKKQYSQIHSGRKIPCMPPKESKVQLDVFRGHVEDSNAILLIAILMLVLPIVGPILLKIMSSPKSPEDLIYTSVSFERFSAQNGMLQLYTETDPEYYGIPDYMELVQDPETFLSLCEGGATFTVGYTIRRDNDHIPYYGLESVIGESGTVYLTMEDIHHYRWRDLWFFQTVFGVLALLDFACVFLLIYVGRHPEKFSDRFIGLFYKEGYVHRFSDSSKK